MISVPSFKFVIATRKKELEKDNLPFFRFLSLFNSNGKYSIENEIFYENSDGLPTVYNKIIESERKSEKKSDFVIFVHDDIWINDIFIFDKILSASKYFDVIGVCGGKGWETYGDGNTPIIWTHASRGKGMSGFMAHAADDSQSQLKHDMTYDGRSIFSTSYGHSPSRTLTVDGCFICFSRSAIERGLSFDEMFKFHFYDMDVCFSAYVNGIKVGTAPILLTHESLGLSVAQPQFIESQKAFLKKWFQKS